MHENWNIEISAYIIKLIYAVIIMLFNNHNYLSNNAYPQFRDKVENNNECPAWHTVAVMPLIIINTRLDKIMYPERARHIVFLKVEDPLPYCIDNLVSEWNHENIAHENGPSCNAMCYWNDGKIEMVDSKEKATRFEETRYFSTKMLWKNRFFCQIFITINTQHADINFQLFHFSTRSMSVL